MAQDIGQEEPSDDDRVAVMEPEQEIENTAPRGLPRYNVVLWDDDEHSYEYVVRMLKRLFGYPTERGYKIAEKVDTEGRAVCITTNLEHAELKRDQIHAFGAEPGKPRCKGSMWATIEKVG
jgi:ATP-dependent Clp protease adaptor protein ClpS